MSRGNIIHHLFILFFEKLAFCCDMAMESSVFYLIPFFWGGGRFFLFFFRENVFLEVPKERAVVALKTKL